MGTHLSNLRFVSCFLSFLFRSSGSSPVLVYSSVGGQAVLPCSWRSRLGDSAAAAAAASPCHVQWTSSPPGTVFEMRGNSKWQAEKFRGRAEVPRDRLGSGDCSLIISDVQVLDTGGYESFMVVDGDMTQKTRVFIQSVRLSVLDHKSREYRSPGEDLVLPLYTSHSVRVLFQDRNSSDWSDLWMRGDNDTERLQKHGDKEQLTIKTLTVSDEGTYKVLDEHGLSVSTVLLSVLPVDEKSTKLQQRNMKDPPSDASGRTTCSFLLVSSLLLFTFL